MNGNERSRVTEFDLNSNVVESVHKYDVSTSSMNTDNGNCGSIRAICRHPGGFLLLDWQNDILLQVNDKFDVQASFSLPPKSQDICQVNGSRIALAMSYGKGQRAILFAEITDEEIRMGDKIDFQHACTGVRYHEGHLYVSSSTALYKYTLDGSLVDKLYEDLSGSETVSSFDVAENGTIYVTSFNANKLIMLDATVTELINLDKELKGPSSVHSASKDRVFICGTESHTVLQVDVNKQKVTQCIATESEGMYYPGCLFFDDKSSQLLVGQLGNAVLVIKLVV